MVNSTLTFSNVIGHICSDLGSWFDPYMIMDGIFKRYEVYLCISPTMATLAGVVCLCLSKPWDCLRPFLLGALKVAGALRKSSGAKEKKTERWRWQQGLSSFEHWRCGICLAYVIYWYLSHFITIIQYQSLWFNIIVIYLLWLIWLQQWCFDGCCQTGWNSQTSPSGGSKCHGCRAPGKSIMMDPTPSRNTSSLAGKTFAFFDIFCGPGLRSIHFSGWANLRNKDAYRENWNRKEEHFLCIPSENDAHQLLG